MISAARASGHRRGIFVVDVTGMFLERFNPVVSTELMMPLSILVIDDDKEVRDPLCELLSNKGHTVSSATDGVAALEYLDTQPVPDIVLLDLNMPRMDGYEFLERRASNIRLSSVPVIVVSGNDHDHRVPFPGTFSLTAILQKPFYATQLFDVLQRVVPRRPNVHVSEASGPSRAAGLEG